MAKTVRIAITIDQEIANLLKGLVEKRQYPTVSFAIESIVRDSLRSEKSEKKNGKVK